MTAPSPRAGSRSWTPPRSIAGRLIAAALLGLLLLLAADRVLGLLGFPERPPWYPVGPPFFELSLERLEYAYVVRTNDRGIRYRTIPLVKPEGTHRVVLIGDSFTEGACVREDERWSSRIEAQLRDRGRGTIELVNCGEAGTHLFDYGRTLVHLGLAYEPDAVVVGLYVDDLPNTPAGLDTEAIHSVPSGRGSGLRGVARTLFPHLDAVLSGPRRRRASEDLDLLSPTLAAAAGIDDATSRAWRDAIPDDLLAAAAKRRISPGLLTQPLLHPLSFEEGIGLETEDARAKLLASERLLDEMVAVCAERGVSFGVILMPSVHQYDPASSTRLTARLFAAVGHPLRPEWTTETTGIQRALSAWSEERGIPFLDLVPVFRRAVTEAEEPLNFELDPHWTAAGHAVAAEEIRRWMETAELLPP